VRLPASKGFPSVAIDLRDTPPPSVQVNFKRRSGEDEVAPQGPQVVRDGREKQAHLVGPESWTGRRFAFSVPELRLVNARLEHEVPQGQRHGDADTV